MMPMVFSYGFINAGLADQLPNQFVHIAPALDPLFAGSLLVNLS
jgi:hypothetical protein